MKIEIATSNYNARRYGKPWIAKVTFDDSGKAMFEWGSFVGDDRSGLLMIEAEPGEIIASGQKDGRGKSETEYFEVLGENGASLRSVSKVDAFRLYRERTADAVSLAVDEFGICRDHDSDVPFLFQRLKYTTAPARLYRVWPVYGDDLFVDYLVSDFLNKFTVIDRKPSDWCVVQSGTRLSPTIRNCPDSPSGLHEFDHDEEYAQKHQISGEYLSCIHCGALPD